ncbi:DUF1304 domain-containing protein [Chryseobacterium tongliaoense]|uniref:DUF1304 domain-containing protein n=1 Tax=Chryseobacterium tongliaoense TaxID=3240933 RepID=UPI003511D6B5
MNTLAFFLTAFVSLEHLYIFAMEVFAWETLGKKTFKTLPEELFEPSKKLAANQGVYNGFLSIGLAWSCFIDDPIWSENIGIFFLSCVIVAGIFGAWTITSKIFFTQAVPAIIALTAVLIS